MKKICLLLCTTILLSGCVAQTRKVDPVTTPDSYKMDVRPLQASIQIGRKMKGRADCLSILGIPFKSPKKQAFGSKQERELGNIAPDACTRGAVYNALSRSDADIIVTPRYEAESFNFLCIPFTNLCVWNESTAWVTGYEGKYTNFREIDPEIIYQNQLNRYGKQNTAVSDSSSSASFVSSLMSYLPF